MFQSSKYLLVCLIHYVGIHVTLKLLCYLSPSFFLNVFENCVFIVLCLFIARYTFEFTRQKVLNDNISSNGKAVLITGCDSGFGHFLAKRMDARGYQVFATCLFPSGPGANELRMSCSSRLHVLGMNVAKDESVKEAFKFVKNNLENSELWAVVNNAGIQKGFTTDFASLQDFKDTMEVNCFGMVRVTKAFLPLLKQSRGRIVNLTSLHGRIASPYNTPYSMSKYAAAGFSDSLKLEMNVWGIRVIQIEPELFQTILVDSNEVCKRYDAEVASVDQELRNEYGEKFFKDLKAAVKYLLNSLATPKIYKVVDALESAISSKYPKTIYRPSRNEFVKIGRTLLEIFPSSFIETISRITTYCVPLPKPIKA